MKPLANKTAFVTGGAQGLGKGIALELAKAGADIIIADLNSDKVESVVMEIKALGRDAIAVQLDVTDATAIESGVQQALKHFSKVDILVNNAGIDIEGPSATTSEQFDLTYAVNTNGVWQVSNALVPHFKANQSGKIINIASIAGRRGQAAVPAYGASKAAVISLTQSLACALGPDNINVNAVCPGVVKTPLTITASESRSAPDLFENYTAVTQLKRDLTAEDIGCAVVFFASEQARNITGQSLNVDGGYCMN